MSYISELQDTIRQPHGVESTHIKTIPVKETFRGKTVWDGAVEVFKLHGHPKAHRAYAWAHDTDDPKHPRRPIAVLHLHPVSSARDAVRAAIIQEFRSLGQELDT